MSSVLGVALLVAITVVTAGVVGTTVFSLAPDGDGPPRVTMTGSADAEQDRVTLTHRGGATLTVSSLRIEIHVDGQPLSEQPPVPFFAADGFESGPTGPFNIATEGEWTAGETATVRIASTNSPQLVSGSQVTVHIYTGDYRIVTVEATA